MGILSNNERGNEKMNTTITKFETADKNADMAFSIDEFYVSKFDSEDAAFEAACASAEKRVASGSERDGISITSFDENESAVEIYTWFDGGWIVR
jgi:hypothetical protein